jgi:hypothetical protein
VVRWRVLAVRGGIAIVDGGKGRVFKVRSGSAIPGVGIVGVTRKLDGRWTIATSAETSSATD